MKRSELEVGALYVGPGGQCYEVVDTSPGWRLDHSGGWVQDESTRSRYMPGKGSIPYRTNLAVKAYLHMNDAQGHVVKRAAVVDPRKLMGPWVEYVRDRKASDQAHRKGLEVAREVRKALRKHPDYRPKPAHTYDVSTDGREVTVPVSDLRALLELIPQEGAPTNPAVPMIQWSS